MKMKHVALSVGAALFSATSLHAAMSQTTANTPRALNINAEEVAAFSAQVQEQQVQALSAQAGTNIHINSQQQKFVKEGLEGEHIYIVRLTGQPVAIAARDANSALAKSLQSVENAKPFSRGQATTKAVSIYKNQLLKQQQAVAYDVASVTGHSDVRRQFTNAINGFSIKMTEAQAAEVAKLANVSGVMRSKHYDLLSDQGPLEIHADKVWDGTATPNGLKNKGEGQIVGIIDTGINSDHPSFAAVGGDGYEHENPWGDGQYVGDCVEDSDEIQCNNKLIGVRSYDVITDTYDAMIPGWPAIGEDYQGHGSHVASTAAGNVLYDVPLMLTGYAEQSDGVVAKDALFPQISGVAPHANIIAYQACYPDNDFGYVGCPGEALVAAIEDAIADGVDVINYSIGGSDKDVWSDPVQLSFLAAREAGINVAAAAGNSGQSCALECMGGVDNSSPWLAQVAATTHSREIIFETPVEYAGFAEGSNGTEVPSWSETGLVGGALNKEAVTGVVVWSKDYEDVNGETDYNGYCGAEFAPGTFDFYKDGTPIAGAAEGNTDVIVICQRHNPNDTEANARTAKIDNIKAGGADGFIMFNNVSNQATVAEAYSLPGVHFTNEQWNGINGEEGLEDWVDHFSEYGHMITIGATIIEREVNADNSDWLATFSSRGPSYENLEVLAPALAAPGVNIYAAYSDEHPFTTPNGTDYKSVSGTSMASPHVAGAMALLRQTHPQWTPTEIQSALLMTADNVVKYNRMNTEGYGVGDAEIYRAGAGRINVESAAEAGLIMDESAENFLAANPYNGGVLHKLNLPNLVDFSCAPECQWVRTVKATKDGTWELSHGAVTNWAFDMALELEQNGVTIDFEPKRFSLKAGETQNIIVKAKVMESQTYETNSEVELHSEIFLTEVNGTSPQSRWPMAFTYDRGDLPAKLDITAHENTGSYRVNGLELPEGDQAYSRVHEVVKANVKTVTLPKDDDNVYPFSVNQDNASVDKELILDEATITEFITVPENTSRLIAEVFDVIESPHLGTLSLGKPIVYVGKDYNGNGEADLAEELICYSNDTIYHNYCNLQYPDAGEYWVVLYNSTYRGITEDEETFSYAIEAVSTSAGEGVSATLVDQEAGNFDINWQLDMQEGDIFYSQMDVGSSEVNAGNLGSVPLKFIRGANRTTVSIDQTHAALGDQIPVTFKIAQNNSGMARDFTISTPIPEGISLDADQVMLSNEGVATVSIENGVLTITGTQEDTSNVEPDYIVTNSVTDQSCRTPDFGNVNPGGYVDLREFGIYPSLGGFDDSGLPNYTTGWMFPLSTFSGGAYDKYSLYNNLEEDNVHEGVIQVRGNGMVNLSTSRFPATYHMQLPYGTFPYEVIAPLWRGTHAVAGNHDIMTVELGSLTGLSLASTQDGWGIIEWDDASDYGDFVRDPQTRLYTGTKRDNSFDFELIFHGETRFGDNQHEMYFAYDNIDYGTTGDRGSIGIQGYKGPLYIRGPVNEYRGEQVAYNNLSEVIEDDMVVCFDYVGPESSQFSATAYVTIPRDASGRALNFDTTIEVSGMETVTLNNTVTVEGNITLADIANMTTPENTAISFDIMYVDEQNSANTISASGENMTATVEGDTITITPEQNFHGDIEVTVTVADVESPSDHASQTFILTVESDGEEPVITEPDTDTDSDSGSSSGSLAWMLLLLTPFAWLRRKQVN